jgi:hypothetical protein
MDLWKTLEWYGDIGDDRTNVVFGVSASFDGAIPELVSAIKRASPFIERKSLHM